jgi:hypothetical protein
MIIGKKLLIYTVVEEKLKSLEADIRNLLIAGQSDREEHALNRFRLVIASREPERVRAIAGNVISSFENGDERMHLHVVNSSELP